MIDGNSTTIIRYEFNGNEAALSDLIHELINNPLINDLNIHIVDNPPKET